MFRLRLWVLVKYTLVIRCLSHCIMLGVHDINKTYHWLFTHLTLFLGEVVFARFLHCKITVFPINTLFFGSELLSIANTQGEED